MLLPSLAFIRQTSYGIIFSLGSTQDAGHEHGEREPSRTHRVWCVISAPQSRRRPNPAELDGHCCPLNTGAMKLVILARPLCCSSAQFCERDSPLNVPTLLHNRQDSGRRVTDSGLSRNRSACLLTGPHEKPRRPLRPVHPFHSLSRSVPPNIHPNSPRSCLGAGPL